MDIVHLGPDLNFLDLHANTATRGIPPLLTHPACRGPINNKNLDFAPLEFAHEKPRWMQRSHKIPLQRPRFAADLCGKQFRGERR